MSNNEQSSVDYFWNQLPEILPFTVGTETAVKLFELYEQAIAMHKEEMKEMYLKGIENYDTTFKRKDNETFGG